MLPRPRHALRLPQDLALSETLCEMYGMTILPSMLIKILTESHIPHVLIGAHALSAWACDPRATIDVDVVVADPEKARLVILAAFADLRCEDRPTIIRFFQDQRRAIDVVKPLTPLYQQALKSTTPVTIRDLQFEIPQLEMAIALTFDTLSDPKRRLDDKYQAAHDVLEIVDSNPVIDQDKLASFGELLFPGGGPAILKLLNGIRSGGDVSFEHGRPKQCEVSPPPSPAGI
jgi:hypothetical protein